ncbi:MULTISPECIES: ABC transporter ATP-binding protein [Aerococcus]|uniref:ABC transporter ATP-binding protein n=1 Tax=Aerococcus sanguinicola TaxID=119206 RepID=A0A5N1GTM0_9LACT|nr:MULTISPECIES: ABC transporter ATP-binding protein [Aerococcus]KAA9301960.1 ABC transporter ATP-binding protein [Aerococcus sanguinicola]MDK6368615.1 ABC transporter ATP-binding protein [Aerococcus sp. UMB9870]MDK6686030.1 ABC transporter ATP-binding protein [Aerococcus sp. UMB8623]MDK6940836.1 ABC transporter ATP-binding protein [Aerococcus sp. UMB8487]OFK21321.1 ABC transporter ATP-binding protein [Aerococcus sp. HMSC072A12]
MTQLSLENIYKAFPKTEGGIQLVLADINLKASDQEFICIVGPSGCGKSTLLNMIAGLTPSTKGEIRLNDRLVEDTDPNRGMVFQNPTLFPWRTVEENIKFSQDMKKEVDQAEVDRIIQLIGLEDYKNYYPHQLSGGMAQRVSLARTMINQPEVFLLDEPLGALDAFTRASLQDELISLWQSSQNLMIMVTHDVEEAVYMATRVVIMQPHPGRFSQIVNIDLDYPRRRTSQAFINYRNEILQALDF